MFQSSAEEICLVIVTNNNLLNEVIVSLHLFLMYDI